MQKHKNIKCHNKKVRQSNFELLRILLMLFVVGGHVLNFGTNSLVYNNSLFMGGEDFVISNYLYGICVIAVNTFILISGYFGISLKLTKLLKIEFMVLFYSWLIACYLVLSRNIDFQLFLKYLMPVISKKYWFVTIYFILCIFAPVLNFLANSFNKWQFSRFLLVISLTYYGVATFAYVVNFPQIIPDWGGGIFNFTILYMTGRYIRIYDFGKKNSYFYFAIFCVFTIFYISMQCLYSTLLGFSWTNFTQDNSIFVYIGSILFFLAFKNCNIGYQRLINALSLNCLAVFIIHNDYEVIFPFISETFHLGTIHGLKIITSVIYVPIVIYLGCILIEYLRKFVFGHLEDIFLNKIVIKHIFSKSVLCRKYQ